MIDRIAGCRLQSLINLWPGTNLVLLFHCSSGESVGLSADSRDFLLRPDEDDLWFVGDLLL